MGERGDILSIHPFKISFTRRKVLRHGTFPLYFPSERKVCCGFLSPLKIHHLGRVLNPQPLGPVVSTLTTTPPRRLLVILTWQFIWLRGVNFHAGFPEFRLASWLLFHISRSIRHQHKVTLVQYPTQKFIQPPCYYYSWQWSKQINGRVASMQYHDIHTSGGSKGHKTRYINLISSPTQ
jgi:hypothetical protein